MKVWPPQSLESSFRILIILIETSSNPFQNTVAQFEKNQLFHFLNKSEINIKTKTKKLRLYFSTQNN